MGLGAKNGEKSCEQLDPEVIYPSDEWLYFLILTKSNPQHITWLILLYQITPMMNN